MTALRGRNSLLTDILETAECMSGEQTLVLDPINLFEMCERVFHVYR